MDKIDGLIAVELWNVGKFFWQLCTDWAPLMNHNSWVWRARCWVLGQTGHFTITCFSWPVTVNLSSFVRVLVVYLN